MESPIQNRELENSFYCSFIQCSLPSIVVGSSIPYNSHFTEVVKRSDGEMLVTTNILVVLENFIYCFLFSYRSKTDPVTGAVKNTKYHQL